MEYRKEDLMEAKKQILGVGENMGTEESKKIWEENAQFWYLYYNESDYYQRLGQTLGQVKPKATKKMKLYKIDGDIPFHVISDLVGISLDGTHNPEVRKLLNGE